MFILTIKLALRNILRNRLFSLINILGLSLGLAAILYVLVLVRFETGFDRSHPDGDRIYRANTIYTMNDQKQSTGYCWAYVVSEMKGVISGVEEYCRVSKKTDYKAMEGMKHIILEGVRFVDQSFFEFFDFKLIKGSEKDLFSDPGAVALTEKEAKRLFGEEDPMGKVLLTSNNQTLTVKGILAEPTRQTHLDFKALVSFKTVENDPEKYLGWDGGQTFLSYIKLGKHVSLQSVESQLEEYLFERINNKYEPHGWKVELSFSRLKDIHLGSGLDYDLSTNRDPKQLWLYGSIALIILLLAIINYINLTSALLSRRVHETGVRKVMGASRLRIMIQFLAESVTVTTLALILSIVWLKSFYPAINRIVRADFQLAHFTLFVFITSIILILFTGIIAGIGPSLLLARQRSITALRKVLIGGNKQTLRNSLIVFQFGVAIVLICSFLLINRQTNFMMSKDLGFRSENIVGLFSDKGLTLEDASTARQEMLKLPEVEQVCISSEMPGRGLTGNGYQLEGKEDVTVLNVIYTDGNFLDCFDIKLLEGRDFRDNLDNEGDRFLVNEALVDFANWDDPIGKKINRRVDHEVVGVFSNFNFSPLIEEVKPLIISVNPMEDGWRYHTFNVRYNTNNIPGLMKKLNRIWVDQLPGIVFDYQFLDNYLNQNFDTLRNTRKMMSIFSILAFLIAGIGLFGMSAFITENRSKEIGIRKVNGARIIDILQLLTMGMARWVLFSFILASPLAYFIMHKWLENFPYKTNIGIDIFLLAGFGSLALAILTISYVTIRIATKNPVETLRYE